MNKKLAILAAACAVLIILGSINSNVLFGTQYISSKKGYSFIASEAASWWDCDWSYAKKIIIDHTLVETDQSNFPVLLYNSSDTDLRDNAQSDGDDIVFVDANNLTQYDHEIEKFDSSTGELVVWVEIRSLSSTEDTILYMYYGNPSCENQQNSGGTWNSNYKMVHHLNETSGIHYDSTQNYNNGTISGGVTQGTSGLSQLDGCDSFDGTSQHIDFGNDTSLNPSSITIEGWVKDPEFNQPNRAEDIRIADKRDEHRPILSGKRFYVERTISGKGDVVFAALYSEGLLLQEMTIDGSSILDGTYIKGTQKNAFEENIENIRMELPDTLKMLEMVSYSHQLNSDGDTTLRMCFTANGFCSEGSISYLVFSDTSYDYECSTHWALPAGFIDPRNPFFIFKDILDFFTGENTDNSEDISHKIDGNLLETEGGMIIEDSIAWENSFARLEVYPHTSYELTRHTQYADLSWYKKDTNIDVAFRFDENPKDSDIWMWQNISHEVKVSDYGDILVNYTLDNITSFTVLSETPEDVDYGDIPSEYYVDVTVDTGNSVYDLTVGYDRYEWLNSDYTAARFFYEYYSLTEHHYEDQYWFDWKNVKTQFQHAVYNGKHYYYLSNIPVMQDETYRFKWQYTVPVNSKGKWELFAKLHADTIQEALESGRYILLDPWWNGSWSCYQPITIESDYIDDPLANFPVLVIINSTVGVKCDGGNSIRFLSTDNITEFNYEIELWNSSNNSYVWVNISEQIPSSSDYTFLIYYNNSAASDNQNPTGVWDANYTAVWHLNETTGTVYDSTSNGYDSSAIVGVTQDATGKIDGGDSFDGSSDYIDITMTLPSTVTISAWATLTGTNDMLWCIDSDSQGPDLFFESNSQTIALNTWDSFSNPFCEGPGAGWHLYTAVIESGNTKLYINDSLGDTANYRNPTGSDFHISSSAGYDWTGTIDEVRISNIARNTSWINATFHTMNQTTGFLTWGGENERATITWDGSESNVWTLGDNWVGGIAPTSIDDVIIDGNYANAPVISSDVTIYSLKIGENNASVLSFTQDTPANLTVTNNITVFANGTINVTRSSTTGNGRGRTITAADIDIQSGGTINADGEGFAAGQGPGTSASADGGSHGGRGGDYVRDETVGSTYGSLTNPTSLGSGGYSGDASTGGGVINISATGTVTVNGRLSANGTSSNSGGAGGSINIIADTLTGSGTIQANGGIPSSNYGAGGGGRISFKRVTTDTFNGTLQVNGYKGTEYSSYAGTIYFNSGKRTNLTLGTGNITSLRLGSDDSNNYTFGNITIQNGATLEIDGNPNRNNPNGGAASFTLTSLDIQTGGTFKADGLGFARGLGPGYGTSADGGSHGGRGGDFSNDGTVGSTYGSLTNPMSLGSGGFSSGVTAGGGAINISATGTVTVNGTLSANGNSSNAGGAGGSINIIADTLTGSGTIQANGGSASSSSYGAGGGGRISLKGVTTDTFNGTLQVNGYKGAKYSYAGTIYFNQARRDDLTLGTGNITSLRLGSDDSNNYTFGNITIQNGATLEIDGNPNRNSPNGGAASFTLTSLDIQTGGTFKADGLGFGPGLGPGYGTSADGGSHGGRGGDYSNDGTVGSTYGSLTNPMSLGSGGFSSSITAGGGAINISATGTVTVNGTLSANGNSSTAGGAGGSINIIADMLTGSGTIQANGGSASNGGYGGGGGGRTSFKGVTTDTFNGTLQVNGYKGAKYSYAGTIYFNSGKRTNLTLGTGNITSLRLGSDDSNNYTFGNITIQNGATLEIDGNPYRNNPNGGAASFTLTSLDIQTGGVFKADGFGFGPATGPGTGVSADGGSHGGRGGDYQNNGVGPTYGSITNPTSLGSGGWSGAVCPGGGAINISATGTVTVNGTLSANGNSSNAGGAGGSINIIANTLTGSGTIRANGGNASQYSSGGGGRISVTLSTGTSFDSITFKSYGGSTNTKAAAGMIYKEDANDGTGNGELIINNNDVSTSATTNISTSVTDIDVGNATIQNSGILEIAANLTTNGMTIASGATCNITCSGNLTMNGVLTLNGDFNIVNGNAFDVNLSNTKFNLTNGTNIALHTIPNTPSDPNGYTNISKYVNLTSIGASSTVDINISYSASDVASVNESSLTIWEYNETTQTWAQASNTGVDTSTNYVWANSATNFSIYGPLGEPNTAPEISNPYPTNGSTGISPTPTLNIIVNDSDGDTMSITWYSNSSGTWQLFGINTSCSNGTYHQTNSNFSNYGITYYWNISVSDGITTNNSDIYHFTTQAIDTSVDTITPYEQTTSPLTIDATGPSDLSNVTLWYRYSTDNSTWWNTSWSERKPVYLNVSSGTTSKNYQVLLNITYDNDMNNDFSDLRFVNHSDDSTELDYWVENKSDGNWALVWVEIDDNITTINQTLAWIYYGNPDATSVGNGSNTFVLFDDFSGTTYDDSIWGTNFGSNVQVSDGTIALWGDWNTGGHYFATDNSFTSPIIAQAKARITSLSSDMDLSFGFQNSQTTQWWTDANCVWCLYDSNGGGSANCKEVKTGGVQDGGNEVTSTDWETHIIDYLGSGVNWYDSNLGWLNTTRSTYSPFYFSLAGDTDSASMVYVDYVFLRNYSSQKPTYSIGSEDGWMEWNDTSNPDDSSPWSWDFDFPNDTGYYEFYSIGKKSGSTDETAPNSADVTCFYRGNTAPEISNPYPSNESTDVSLNPMLNITVNDTHGDTMTITWYSNSSGTWQLFGINTSCSNGTYHQTNSNFSNGSTIYWWNVSVSDGIDTNNSGIYHFTTNMKPTLSSESPSNGSASSAFNPTLSIQINDTKGDTMTIQFWTNASGSWQQIGTENTSATNGTYTRIPTNMDSYNMIYYWSVNATDPSGSGDWTNETYHFTTIAANKEIMKKSRSTYSFEISPTGTTLYGYVKDTNITCSIDTNWHYVALTYDGSNLRLYKDGEQVNSTALSGSIPTTSDNVIAGKNLTGWLDELRISNTARSPAWINTSYQNMNAPTSFARFESVRGVLSAWTHRKKITFNSSLVNETLTNFPALIYNNSDSHLSDNALSTGNDVIFMETSVDWTNGTWRDKLDHEIEKFDNTTGELVAWVRIPSLFNSTNTEIYMYYGSTLCTTNRENASGVWDANYTAVWHLSETPTVDSYANDSTSNSNNGTFEGSMTSSDQVTGQIDGSLDFDGSDDCIDLPNEASSLLGGASAATVSVWAKRNTTGTRDAIIDLTISGTNSKFFVEFQADNKVRIGGRADSGDSFQSEITNSTFTNNTWYHIVGILDIANDDILIYSDGGNKSTTGSPSWTQTTFDADVGSKHTIGIAAGVSNGLSGQIDEVRISNIKRNASWINTTFNNMNDTSSFLTFGKQERPNVAPALSNPSPANGATGQSLNPTLSITVNDTNSDTMNITFRTNATGTWGDIGSNNSINNGTYYQTNSSMNNDNTTYYWSINCTDGTTWTNATYSFTTQIWWNNTWSYRKLITINSSQVNSDLTNFPILVSITDTDLKDDAQNDGDDIVFINSTSTKLNHEIELFNGTSGELIAWVNVTSLSSSSNTKIWMYYGNATCSSQENVAGVWSSSYTAVLHLNSNFNDSVDGNFPTNSPGASLVTGKIGKGADVQVDGDEIDYNTSSALGATVTSGTVEFWMNASEASYDYVVDVGYGSGIIANYDGTTDPYLQTYWGGWRTGSTGVVTKDAWHYVVVRWNSSVGFNMWVDGSYYFDYSGSKAVTVSKVCIGNYIDHGNYETNGILDEVRFAGGIELSDDWINTIYNTTNNPGTFLSFGSEESQS